MTIIGGEGRGGEKGEKSSRRRHRSEDLCVRAGESLSGRGKRERSSEKLSSSAILEGDRQKS